uniref:KRAB domain-containing protein n=1 Tax=Podarcis muralis TaxID=64176 RepID=A0A670KJB9_PODMU
MCTAEEGPFSFKVVALQCSREEQALLDPGQRAPFRDALLYNSERGVNLEWPLVLIYQSLSFASPGVRSF